MSTYSEALQVDCLSNIWKVSWTFIRPQRNKNVKFGVFFSEKSNIFAKTVHFNSIFFRWDIGEGPSRKLSGRVERSHLIPLKKLWAQIQNSKILCINALLLITLQCKKQVFLKKKQELQSTMKEPGKRWDSFESNPDIEKDVRFLLLWKSLPRSSNSEILCINTSEWKKHFWQKIRVDPRCVDRLKWV